MIVVEILFSHENMANMFSIPYEWNSFSYLLKVTTAALRCPYVKVHDAKLNQARLSFPRAPMPYKSMMLYRLAM